MNEAEEILLLEELAVSYGPVRAVEGINLQLDRGEFIALIGANGAGKTTLLKAVLGLARARGRIFFQGKEITDSPTNRIVASGISFIPEGHTVFSSMSVLENLYLGAYHNEGNLREALAEVFNYFPVLKKRKNQTAGTLSGGEQQMLSIGRALMAGPELILVDEPSLGLAPAIVSEIFKIFEDLNHRGLSVLLAEQNARKALEYSDRGYLLETGRVVLTGVSGEMMAEERVKQAYLGSST